MNLSLKDLKQLVFIICTVNFCQSQIALQGRESLKAKPLQSLPAYCLNDTESQYPFPISASSAPQPSSPPASPQNINPFTRLETTESHPCFRECSSDLSKRMTCGYKFTLEYFLTLSKACYECPNVTADCFRLDCIPADGVKRPIAVVNRLLPGPAIRVCEGDTVVVDVRNELMGADVTAIHWHGLHQMKTPWMDGVPRLTQCSIPTGSTFRYEFETPLEGTYFWHSHSALQRGDGIFGSFVVRAPKKPKAIYDYDLPEHEFLIWDWCSDLTLSVFLKHHHSDGDNKPRNILINGKGIPPGFFQDFLPHENLQSKGKPFYPIHEVRVKHGSSYRFRFISNGVLNCPLEMSIENHTFEIIASDGSELEPVPASSLVIYAGERWDIVIRANQTVGSYWIKVRGLMDCSVFSVYQVAVLNYDGVPEGSLPNQSIKSYQEAAAPSDGILVNPLNTAPGVQGKYVTVLELNSLEDDDPEIISKEKADHQFYFSYDFNPIDNIHFHGPNIPIKTIRKGQKLYTPQLNYISNVMPKTPPLTQPETYYSMNACNETSMKSKNCSVNFCECTHLITVPLNSIVEIVLVDRGYTFYANHPFHLHGHVFRVVRMERLNKTTEPSLIKERDALGLVPRRRSKAPIKDTVTVPDGGYTILRFRANNPGFWHFHCHLEFHMEIGMGLIIQVGSQSEMLQAPANFPKCSGDYIPKVQSSSPIVYQGKQ